MSLPVGEAAEQLDSLNRTVAPNVDAAAVDRFIAKVKEANGEVVKLEGGMRRVGRMSPTRAGGVSLQPGGSVRRAIRGENSDAGM